MTRRGGKVVVSERQLSQELTGVGILAFIPAVIITAIIWVIEPELGLLRTGTGVYLTVLVGMSLALLLGGFDDKGDGKVDAEGFRDGFWEWKHNGSVVRQTQYENGVREGPYRQFSADETLVYEAHFEQDHMVGIERIWDLNGHVAIESNYVEGNRHGESKKWGADGLELEAQFHHGLPHGKWTWYESNDKPWVEIEFSYGVPHGTWRELRNGQVVRLSHFNAGIQHPIQQRFEADTERYRAGLNGLAPPIPTPSTPGRILSAITLAAIIFMLAKDPLTAVPIIALLFIIGIHELGHLLAAKMVGIPIRTFRMGIGPLLCGFQWGQTRYELAVIPLMGYVMPYLMRRSEFEHVRKKSISHNEVLHPDEPDEELQSTPELVSWRRRMVFYLGGVAVNFAFAAILLWALGDLVPQRHARLRSSNPAEASIKVGREMGNFAQLTPRILYSIFTFEALRANADQKGAIATMRDQAKEAVDSVQIKSEDESPQEVKRRQQRGQQLLVNLVLIFCFMNIAVVWFNLLPIPPLDGFQVLIGTIESATGQPWRKKLATPLILAGAVFIVALMLNGVVSIGRDISTILSK